MAIITITIVMAVVVVIKEEMSQILCVESETLIILGEIVQIIKPIHQDLIIIIIIELSKETSIIITRIMDIIFNCINMIHLMTCLWTITNLSNTKLIHFLHYQHRWIQGFRYISIINTCHHIRGMDKILMDLLQWLMLLFQWVKSSRCLIIIILTIISQRNAISAPISISKTISAAMKHNLILEQYQF